MEVLFTDTSVLLCDDFVKSITKENLECKLKKLMLVCHTKYIHVDNTYAICGKWEHIDAAFQILAHWHEKPDHEPNMNVLNIRNGTVNHWCCCEDMVNVVDFKDFNQTESESRNSNVDKTSQKAWDKLISYLMNENNHTHVPDDVRKSKKNVRNGYKKNKGKGPSADKCGKKAEDSMTKDIDQPDLFDSEIVETESDSEKNDSDRIENFTDIHSEVDPTHVAVKLNSSPQSEVLEVNKKVVSSNIKNEKDTKGEKRYWSRVKRTDGDLAHQCSKCDVVLKSRKRYLEHLRRIHVKEYQCQICKKGFGYPTDLKRHTCRKMENSSKPAKKNSPKKLPVSLSCSECPYTTTTNSRLQNHVKRTHSLNFKCDQCDKKFGFSADLEKHKYITHTEKLYFCDQCAKCYKNKQGFDAHLKTHGSDYVKPSFLCDICSKSFTTNYSLAEHVKSEHYGVKKVYLCQICGKKFSQRNSYRQHCNAHNGIKPYKCNKCDKEFVYHKSLKEHEFMHDNVRRFRCTVCDKAFRQRTVLHIHMKTHKAEKDHRCPVCGRGFSQKQAMERHERIHSGVRPYTCQLCKKSFGDTSTIRRHMIALHKKSETNWRENVTSATKKKSDHYVFEGSGQNRTYKSKSTVQEPVENDVHDSHGVTDVMSKSPATLPDASLVVINPLLNGAQGLKVNNVVNGSVNLAVPLPQLQLSTLYAIATNQQQPSPHNPDNGVTMPAVQIKNNLPQVLDFSTMTLVATKLPQTLMNKSENNDNFQQLQIQGDNSNILQTATLVPLTGVTENLKHNPGEISNPNAGDAGISQAIWGFVGYPSACNTDNFTQYQSQ